MGEMRLVVDGTLGKLAKWLRIFGYDTEIEHKEDNLYRLANEEERIVITRKRNKLQYSKRIFVVGDRLDVQLNQVISGLGLQLDATPVVGRCSVCNSVLIGIEKTEVDGKVPSYVQQNHHIFRRCPSCFRIYWPGSHLRRMEDFVKKHIPSCPPLSFQWHDGGQGVSPPDSPEQP